MSQLIAIDPGLNCAGAAMFEDGKLRFAASINGSKNTALDTLERVSFISAQILGELAPRIHGDVELIVEWPQIYQRGGGKTKGDPNDLIALAAVDAYVCARLVTFPMARSFKVRSVTPAEWKGQTPKPKSKKEAYIIEQRAFRRLDDNERFALPPAMTWDGWDAVALGLWALGRFERRILPGAT